MENHWDEWRLLEEGEAKGFQKGLKEGRAQERAKAKKAFSQEMERIRRLSQLLREKGEIDLAFAVYEDQELREKLCKEYGID